MKNVMALVSSSFDVAMNDDIDRLVAYNPVTGMAPRSTAADDIERVFLSPRQFQDLREHTIDHYLNLLLFMVLTGLRWGEAGGLRVRDMSLAPESGRPYLEVRVALKRIKGGTVLGLLKSKAARRRLTIPEVLVPVITTAIAGKDLDACVFTSPFVMPSDQISFTDVEYSKRRRVPSVSSSWTRCCGCTCCRRGSRCRTRASRTRSTTRMRCAGSWDWTSRSSRSPTPRRCCTSGTCWRSISWAGSCWSPGGDLRGAGLDHARGNHRRRDDHRRSVAGEER